MNEEDLEHCPKCGKDLATEVEEDGQMKMGSRIIGVEIRGVYDGTLYWLCPDCDIAFHRWPDGHPFHVRAQRFIDQHNLTTLKRNARG